MCSHEEAKPNSVLQMYGRRCASNYIDIIITYLKNTFNCKLDKTVFNSFYLSLDTYKLDFS